MSRLREYLQDQTGRPSGGNKGVELEGWDDWLIKVKALGDSMKVNMVKGIVKKNMLPIAEAIKKNAPFRDKKWYQGHIIRKRKDGSISTDSTPGNLRRSIGVKVFGSRTGEVTGYAGIQKGKGMSGFKADGWYGFFVERGTKNIAKKPFIAPAAAIATPKAAERLQDDVKGYIITNAKKLGLDAK